MDDNSLNSGHSLLEILCLCSLLQMLIFWLTPSFKSYFEHYRCQRTVLDLKSKIDGLRVNAILTRESQILDLLQLKAQNISWQGFVKGQVLVFQTNSLANRLNGYFAIQCNPQFGYRLWLNRLGYARIEAYMI